MKINTSNIITPKEARSLQEKYESFNVNGYVEKCLPLISDEIKKAASTGNEMIAIRGEHIVSEFISSRYPSSNGSADVKRIWRNMKSALCEIGYAISEDTDGETTYICWKVDAN